MAIVSRFPPVDPATLDLPGLLDWQARNNPHLPWAVTPDSKSHTSATRSITFAELAGAAHRVAHRVRPNRRGEDGQVVALLINCDTVQYVAMILGVMRAGLVVSSPVLESVPSLTPFQAYASFSSQFVGSGALFTGENLLSPCHHTNLRGLGCEGITFSEPAEPNSD